MTAKQVARKAKKLLRLCLVSGWLDEDRARRVVHEIVAARRRGYLRVLRQFGRLLKVLQDQHSARVEFAVPSTPDIESSVLHRIESIYGPGIATVFTHNPHLIGGMRIRVGSDLYDGSILNGLTALEKSFGVVSTKGTR
jgi:F-type H+-transporting ATPase subunit delta